MKLRWKIRKKSRAQNGTLYVCKCKWAYYHHIGDNWWGPYWQLDEIGRKYGSKTTRFRNICSDSVQHMNWDWDTSSAKHLTWKDIEENYSDCAGHLERIVGK